MTHGRNGPVSGAARGVGPALPTVRDERLSLGAGVGHAAEDIKFEVEEHTS
jgi:hypothetical protein